jgi:hypothetical protein
VLKLHILKQFIDAFREIKSKSHLVLASDLLKRNLFLRLNHDYKNKLIFKQKF